MSCRCHHCDGGRSCPDYEPETEGSGASAGSRPFSGERRFHDKHGEVEVLRTWGERACKVLVIATGKREILFDENLHRENEVPDQESRLAPPSVGV